MEFRLVWNARSSWLSFLNTGITVELSCVQNFSYFLNYFSPSSILSLHFNSIIKVSSWHWIFWKTCCSQLHVLHRAKFQKQSHCPVSLPFFITRNNCVNKIEAIFDQVLLISRIMIVWTGDLIHIKLTSSKVTRLHHHMQWEKLLTSTVSLEVRVWPFLDSVQIL